MKHFVTLPQAIQLKALGFKERTLTYYENEQPKIYHNVMGWDFNTSFLTCVSRPTYTEAFDWFRKKYGYWSYIKEATKGTNRFYIEKFDEKFFNSDIVNIYEEAEFACLEKLIKIIEQNEQ